MNNRQFIKDYKEAFGEKATLPIAFWHSDTPVAVPEPVNGCFFSGSCIKTSLYSLYIICLS